ncbi:unnamed protein product [Staurois parvus]|uniref:Secreted protein n=1 Tax=Staurois parvus TaxID=386267 RepID=A0ABN9GZH5_9NEOB|nr:unnamed protein product [Staurois parvus]
MLSLVCIARGFFFSSWESACDQHRANQHCPDRGQGSCTLLQQNENALLQALTSARMDTDRSHKNGI